MICFGTSKLRVCRRAGLCMRAIVPVKVIQNLATLRPDIVPPRPMVDPPLKNLECAKFGRWQLLTLESGPVVLMILHPGYGYVGVQLDPDSMHSLKQTLDKLSVPQSQ